MNSVYLVFLVTLISIHHVSVSHCTWNNLKVFKNLSLYVWHIIFSIISTNFFPHSSLLEGKISRNTVSPEQERFYSGSLAKMGFKPLTFWSITTTPPLPQISKICDFCNISNWTLDLTLLPLGPLVPLRPLEPGGPWRCSKRKNKQHIVAAKLLLKQCIQA